MTAPTRDELLAMVEDLEQKMAAARAKTHDNLTDDELKDLRGEFKDIVDTGRALKQAIDQTDNPLVKMIGSMLESMSIDVFEEAYDEIGVELGLVDEQQPKSKSVNTSNTATPNKASTPATHNFANGKFDLQEKDITAQCQAYLDDLALNAAHKSKKALQEGIDVVRGLREDFKGLYAENAEEKEFIQNLPGQSTLLLKILTRQLTLKDAEQTAKKSSKKTVVQKSGSKKPKV